MALELGQTRLPQAAKIRNNWYVTCKSLSASCLTIFRVTKMPTLKTPKAVIISYLRVASCVSNIGNLFSGRYSQKWNNLHLNKRQKTLTLNALARKAKARLPEKMGNLTFRNLHNSLIINNISRKLTCRLSENWRVSPCRTTASSVSEPNLTSGCIAPMSARTTLLQMPELLFLLLPC